jgi:hypothetical protein
MVWEGKQQCFAVDFFSPVCFQILPATRIGGSGFCELASVSSISSEYGSGSRVLMTKN